MPLLVAEALRNASLPVTLPPDEPISTVRPRATADVARASRHDIHFMERLERVSDHHVELALTLYRDEELLAEVLRSIALPEGAERVAISLEDDEVGPFLIATRTGRFVTCLGRGMRIRATETPLVTRARLDAAASRVSRMRERLGAVEQLRRSGGDGLLARAMTRLTSDWRRMPREDAELFVRFAPIIGHITSGMVGDALSALMHYQPRLAHVRWDRLGARDVDVLTGYDRAASVLGHVSVLSDLRPMVELAAGIEGPDVRWTLAYALASSGTFANAVRGLWLVRQAGLPLLPEAVRAERFIPAAAMFKELALGAIEVGSIEGRIGARRLRAPASVSDPDPEGAAYNARLHTLRVGFRRDIRAALDAYRATDVRAVAHGRATLATFLRCDDRDDRVDDRSARAMLANDTTGWLTPTCESIGDLIDVLPSLARMSALDLFLPSAEVRALPPFVPELAAATYRHLAAFAGFSSVRSAYVRETPKVGRNESCPCGSGRKYKRCCGAH